MLRTFRAVTTLHRTGLQLHRGAHSPSRDVRTQQSELWGQKRLVAKLKSALMAKDGSRSAI